ncbi:MAG: SPOR domain-containing protein [Pseudomonadota bacterium]
MKERLIGAVVLVTVAWLLIPVFLDGEPDPTATVSRPVALPGSAADTGGSEDTQRVTIDLRDREPAVEVADTPFVDSLPAAADSQVLPAEAEVAADAAEMAAAAADTTDDVVTPDAQAAAPPVAAADDASSEGRTPVVPERDTDSRAQSDVEPQTAVAEPAVTSTDRRDDGQLWAVQLGSFSDAGNAQRLAARFQSRETPTFVRPIQSDGKTLHRVRIGPVATRAAADAIVARLAAQGQAARAVPHP